MLIHKETMGVLDQYWSGTYVAVGQDRTPKMVEYTLHMDGFAADQWWEVPRMSSLGRRLRAVYPWCDPVVDDTGQLVDIVVWPDWRRAGLPEPPAPMAEPATQAPKRRRQRRPRGLFANLLNC